jgi:acyl-[acyl-carrier-protein]-phospholipid O-acyltransferase/long-chain-fatty-acid--[acyl-carrier-protein] ligase
MEYRKGRAALTDPGFAGFLTAQALGAFNDNAFKTFVALWAVATMPAQDSARLIALAGAFFIAPFLLFSTYAGWVADHWGKKRLIVFFKAAELALLALSFPALLSRNIPCLMALLFLMGAHSAFFGPVKLAIIPEMIEDQDLSGANGLVQMTTFFSIIAGTGAAGLLLEHCRQRPELASLLFAAAAALGLAASFAMPEVPPAGGQEPLRWNFIARSWDSVQELRRYYGIYLATVGAAYFWFVGAIFQMNLLVYGKQLMGVSETVCSYFQVIVALGIALGSYAAGRLSRAQVELGLVPLGALGLVVFCLDLAFAYRYEHRAMADFFLLGLSAGCFVVPLQTLIQQRSPAAERGKIQATGNILSFLGILIASSFLWAFNGYFNLHAGQIFLVTGLMTLAVALYIVAELPDFLTRLLLYPVANILYRIHVEGRENVPLEGPVLLVSNHVSFIDPFLITMANQRLVRFLMFRAYYDLPVANWFFRAMKCIPVSNHDGPKALIRSFQNARAALERGEAVCIFAEGEISRHGQMLRFKNGFERIVDGLDVPVIPVHLDQVWGSIFSFEGGRALFKRPRRIPYPVTVSFGKPLPSSTPAFALRQAIVELGAAAFRHRLAEKPPLSLCFLREAKRHPLRLAAADSLGERANCAGLLVRAAALADRLEKDLAPDNCVGLLLPPSVGAVAANLALSFIGRVPVNLNYSASREIVSACAAKAGIRQILSSRRFMEKLGWKPDQEVIHLEDMVASISKFGAAARGLALLTLPSALVERMFFPKARVPLDSVATIMFTSGSTGIPKGVMLTHFNLLSNVAAVAQVYALGGEDSILGILPFFHAFGFMGTLWLPLVTGMGAVYHYNPLDAKRIGELVAQYRATFLIGTPTFLLGFLRRVEPEKFKTLRVVVVGAEKLRDEVAKSFKEKFGLEPLEGYGCTELSPAAAINIPDIDWPDAHQRGRKRGTVGQPLPGIFMKIEDPDTGRELGADEPGLLLVKGPNVMKGYLGDDKLTAEALRDGYYITGDIAVIDLDGFVTITDRLSRFSKIGGEMVPHIKVEEKLHELAGRVDQTFVVTSVPDVKRGERLVVLYKDFDAVDELCAKLKGSDLPNLWIPAKENFHKVAEFPLLGSGKLDMASLKTVSRELDSVGL